MPTANSGAGVEYPFLGDLSEAPKASTAGTQGPGTEPAFKEKEGAREGGKRGGDLGRLPKLGVSVSTDL